MEFLGEYVESNVGSRNFLWEQSENKGGEQKEYNISWWILSELDSRNLFFSKLLAIS